jgi:glycosyltransferase involved in cell wall biosynthesis
LTDLSSVSVIVPTRDRPEYLLAAAKSVFAQRLLPAEVLIIDDGSGAGAAEALKLLPRQTRVPIRRIEGPRRGPSAARNVGLREAAGEVVAFLDDDDLWLAQKLEWQVRWLAEGRKLGLVGTDCVRTREPTGQYPDVKQGARRLRRVSPGTLLRGNRLVMSSVVARRECFEECGRFDESLSLAQDWDMWLRIAGRWEVGIVPAPLTIYRMHSEQRSANQRAMRVWEVEVVGRALKRRDRGGRWPRGAAWRRVARRRLAWAHCRLGRLLAREGEREEAVQELKRAMRIFPYHPVVWGTLTRFVLAGRAPAGARQG